MTYEEAIRKLEHQKLQFLEEYVDYSGISEAYDMAIEALEKQTAKKPYNNGLELECPYCNTLFVKGEKPMYCDICGQRLDWS